MGKDIPWRRGKGKGELWLGAGLGLEPGRTCLLCGGRCVWRAVHLVGSNRLGKENCEHSPSVCQRPGIQFKNQTPPTTPETCPLHCRHKGKGADGALTGFPQASASETCTQRSIVLL
jgi:hypothetical protein